MRLWDLATQKMVGVLATNPFPRKVTEFSPDGRFLAFEEVNNGIRLLELQTRSEVALLPAWRDKIQPIGFAFAPNEPAVAYSADRSGAILLWNISSKTNIGVFNGHTNVVQALAFSPDGRRLASAALDGTLRIWDVPTRRETLKLADQSKYIWPLVFSPQGETLAVVDEQVKLLDAATGATRKELRGHKGA